MKGGNGMILRVVLFIGVLFLILLKVSNHLASTTAPPQ